MAADTDLLRNIANRKDLLEIGRKAVEDVLIDWRDSRLSLLNRGNGLVVCERDGGHSDIIRMGAETAIKIGLEAIAKHLEAGHGS